MKYGFATGMSALLIVLATAPHAPAQTEVCGSNVVCGGMAGFVTCSRDHVVGYAAMSPATMMYNQATLCGATVSSMGFMVHFYARRPTSMTGPATCVIQAFNTSVPFTLQCTLDNTDGLPVELMEFSVSE